MKQSNAAQRVALTERGRELLAEYERRHPGVRARSPEQRYTEAVTGIDRRGCDNLVACLRRAWRQ